MSIRRCRVVSLLLMLMLSGCWTVSNDEELDPYDMENFDPSSNSMNGKVRIDPEKPIADTKQNVEENLPPLPDIDPKDVTENPTKTGSNPDVCRGDSSPCPSLFQQYVKTLLYHVKGKVYSGAEDLNLRVKLKIAEVEYLEKFNSSNSTDKDVRHIHEILSSMIQLASEVQHGDPTVNRLWIESIVGMPLEKLLMIAAFISIVVLFFGAANAFHFSWRKVAIKMVFFLFVISVFWQWYELYKKEEARQHMEIMKDMPEECRKREKHESLVKTMFLSFKNMFTFNDDECLKYYEHMLIDPFWKVTPTQALAKTVIRFFVAPAREIGEAIQQLLTGTLKGLPAHLWPVALAFIGIFSFLLLFMYFGYKFSLPFGLIAIEPGQRADNSKMLEGLEEQKEQLLQLQESQRRETREMLETMRQDQEQQLQHLKQILALPGIRDHLVKLRQLPKSQAVQGSYSTKGSEVLPIFPALQGSDTDAVSVDSDLQRDKALPDFGGSCSLPRSSSSLTSDTRPKTVMPSKSALEVANGGVRASEPSVRSIVPEECVGEHILSGANCVAKLESDIDSVESMGSKPTKDIDLTEDEKGIMLNTNLSGQSDSFVEISVSNIEAIGKRDN